MPCPHTTTEPRKRRFLGNTVYQEQCLDCGARVGRPIPPESIGDPAGVKWWDVKKAKRPQPGKRKRAYQQRLKAHSWKMLRRKVLERDNWSCRNCGEPATEVHHLNYERLGSELMSDLAASCSDCNRAEREQRMLGTGT